MSGSRDSILTELEEMMLESCKVMYRAWAGRPLMDGEDRPPMPQALVNMLHKAHGCILKTRNAGISDAQAFEDMTPSETVLALEEALRGEREKMAKAREARELELDEGFN